MHTGLRFLAERLLPSPTYGGVALLLICLRAVLSVPAAAQPSFPGVSDSPSLNLRVYPADFWTPRVGPGVGAGFVAHNLARRGDQWLVSAAPARDEQVATVSFASANPEQARQYVLAGVRALHTNEDWLGESVRRTVLERSALRGRVRAGQTFLNQRLLLQPHLTVSHHSIDAVNRPANRQSLSAVLPTPGSEQTGLRIGTDLRFDTRDAAALPTRGLLLQGTWDRYVSLNDTDLDFDQVDLDAYGYVPLGGVHRLATRLSTTVTHSRGDAPVPVYMLPIVGGAVVPGWTRGRFVGSDRLLASTLYRFPLLHYEKLATIEGHVGVHLAGSYDDLDDQFEATVSFEDDPVRSGSTRPLRPSASAGLRFAMPRRDHAAIELAVGVSPEGASVVRLSFTRSLLTLRPSHHRSVNLR